MSVANRRLAKRLHESSTPCTQCNGLVTIERPGWAFSEQARQTPFVADVECSSCEHYFERFDARVLVDAATALDAESRDWLRAYTRAMDWLRTEIQQDEVVATCLGTFFTKTLVAYEGRNPRTGETIRVPGKRRRMFVPSQELRVACGPPPRALNARDLDDDDVVRRYTDGDEEAIEAPAPTKAVDLTSAMDVFVSELVATRAAVVGDVGTFVLAREHDDEQLFNVVHMQFRRSMEPDFGEMQ